MPEVAVQDLIIDNTIYPRKVVVEDRVDLFSSIMKENGYVFPPITVGRQSLVVYNGRHRVEAARKAGLVKIPAKYVDDPNKPIERLLLSVEDNIRVDTPLTVFERRSVVEKALDAYGKLGEERQKFLAALLGVSRGTIRQWIDVHQGKPHHEGLPETKKQAVIQAAVKEAATQEEIAAKTGISQSAVSRILAEQKALEQAAQILKLQKGETITRTFPGGLVLCKGAYGPDVPADKVEYAKNPDGTINYSVVVVEGVSGEVLAQEAVKLARRITWVGVAGLVDHLDPRDNEFLNLGGLTLQRIAEYLRGGKKR